MAIALVAILALSFGTVACSTASSSSSPTPTTPTPTPTPEIVVWAGGVCAARDAFVAQVTDLASSLEYDPNSGQSMGDQFQAQLNAQMDQLQTAAENLGAAVGKIPLDYEKAGTAIVDVQSKVDAFTAARDLTSQHLTAAGNAGDPVSGAAELVQAATAAKDAYEAGMAVVTALRDSTGAAQGDVKDAFERAPECQ